VTKQNIFCEPQLFIGDSENIDFGNVSLIFKADSSLHTLTVTVYNPEYNNFNLFNKPISFYLNYGANDSTPIFRGFIKDVNAVKEHVTIKALDARCFLTGNEGVPISITDANNFDGYTVVQFLQAYIEDNINVNDTIIGLSALKDIENPPLMDGVREENTTDVYNIIKTKIQNYNNDADLNNIKTCFINMVDDGLYSNITVETDKNLPDAYPSMVLTFNNGILDYNYKKRAPASSIVVNSGDVVGKFTYGNTPLGRLGKSISGNYESSADAQEAGIIDILHNYDTIDTLNVKCNKGHYINLGEIVQLQVPELEISKDFRVTGKKITFNNDKLSLSLDLIKPYVIMRNYL